jgi:hypothetical protein
MSWQGLRHEERTLTTRRHAGQASRSDDWLQARCTDERGLWKQPGFACRYLSGLIVRSLSQAPISKLPRTLLR